MTNASSSPSSPYPATFDVSRPAKLSRAHLFLRILILVLAASDHRQRGDGWDFSTSASQPPLQSSSPRRTASAISPRTATA